MTSSSPTRTAFEMATACFERALVDLDAQDHFHSTDSANTDRETVRGAGARSAKRLRLSLFDTGTRSELAMVETLASDLMVVGLVLAERAEAAGAEAWPDIPGTLVRLRAAIHFLPPEVTGMDDVSRLPALKVLQAGPKWMASSCHTLLCVASGPDEVIEQARHRLRLLFGCEQT